jgi:hypothetical protein
LDRQQIATDADRVVPFRYRDPLTGRWLRARCLAERDEIAARYKEWEIERHPRRRRSSRSCARIAVQLRAYLGHERQESLPRLLQLGENCVRLLGVNIFAVCANV